MLVILDQNHHIIMSIWIWRDTAMNQAYSEEKIILI